MEKKGILSVERPDMALEWDYERNGDLTPDEVTAGSGRRVAWKCSLGHRWEASISSRTYNSSGCPYCSGRKAIRGETDLRTLFPEVASEWDYERNGDLTPEEVTVGSDRRVAWKCAFGHRWEASISNRTNDSNGCPYCSGRRAIRGETDLRTLFPEVAAEWDYERNGDLTPDEVTAGSGRLVAWKCALGHRWETSISNRTHGKCRCPYCSGRKPIPGETDLRTMFPEVAAEWAEDLNGDLSPEDVTCGSLKKVAWRCEMGHVWWTTVGRRTNGSGCPYCSGRKAISGETDLLSLNPRLAAEWDYEKNPVPPSEVKMNSRMRAWWKCSEHGHSWRESVYNRTRSRNCPYCGGRRLLKGFNDLATVYPEVVPYWDYERNGFGPDETTYRCGKKLFWKCPQGHVRETKLRAWLESPDCPYCNGTRAMPGETDFLSAAPQLAEEWDWERNEGLDPRKYKPTSYKCVFWKCATCGGSWRATILKRAAGQKCPYCSGRSVVPGKNDLKTLFPEIAEEWCYERNDTTPDMVPRASNRMFWWKCREKGHEFRATPNARLKGLSCPFCRKEKTRSK